jgi:hypothetical protein
MADREQMTDEWLDAAFKRALIVSGDTTGNLLRGFANRVLQSFGDGKALREALDIAYARHTDARAAQEAGALEFASWAVPSGVPTPPPQALVWLYSHCRAIGMTAKSDSGKMEDDIALFTVNLQDRVKELEAAPAPQAVQGALTKAAQDVLAERQRQIDKEGWTPAHDDAHGGGEMASAAAVYALRASGHFESGVPTYWPWDFADYKPKDNRSNLIRAGALVLAEIERLDRMEVKNG